MAGKRKISKEELNKILEEHRRWQASPWRGEGERASLVGCDLKGYDLREAFLEGADLSMADLTLSDLSKANLYGAYLTMAVLNKAKMCTAKISRANLEDASLIGACLRDADLLGASLRGADLTDADLRNAHLRGADLSRSDLVGTDLRGANLNGVNFELAILNQTKVKKRQDFWLARNIESFEGIIFDEDEEEKIKQEREARNRKGEQLFSGETDYLTFSLPNSYGPVQVGRLLFIFSFIYEGVRLALTSPFENMDDLFSRAMFPELYGTTQDEYRLTIESITAGSLIGKLPGPKELVQAVGEVPNVIEKYKSIKTKEQLRREIEIDLEQKELELVKSRQQVVKNELEIAGKQQEIAIRRQQALFEEFSKLSDLASKDGMPKDLVAEIDQILFDKVGQIDRSRDRSRIVAQVVERGTAQLTNIRDNLGGGEFKAGGRDLLPKLDDDIIEADDYDEK